MTNHNHVELPEGYVDFYKKIETWQNEMFFRLKKAQNIDKQNINLLLKERNKPFLEFNDMSIDPELYKGAFIEFTRMVGQEREATADKLSQIVTAVEGMDFIALADHVVNDDKKFFTDLASQKSIAYDLLVFSLDHALRPFLRHYAMPYQDALRDDEDFSWGFGVCPICGAQANYSRVSLEDGRRFLFCEHCFTEWEYKYLGCIFCGNSEPNTIRFFVVEGDEANQVFVCEKCKGYLKTFDERKGMAKTDLFIAGIETVYLDLIAEEQGYRSNVDVDRQLN
ncbi:MAG: formate dehydrogenase accessory protein FdhE [Ignavibacteriales bacterium]